MTAILDIMRRGGARRAVVDKKAIQGEGAGRREKREGTPSAGRQDSNFVLIKGQQFSLPSPPLPSLDFCAHPLVPGSSRLKNPRWHPLSERNRFFVMKPPVTTCKQARRFKAKNPSVYGHFLEQPRTLSRTSFYFNEPRLYFTCKTHPGADPGF